ncbi:putative NAD/FAD-dependent oxidoreductase [Halarchaeum rubridurum]|uniref:NAD/FAD-dependent oxidoreductase n=1 Tax=Halarchaeum rubridurum TaxID=489911 RepID=A0A830FTU8_9EURY|nr:FAD-dependent oxidoreductase [Halarchaeum rubridurum]MBP1954305.1 putative NAD/FAD-dependent oxidoreductase [Halarchaeum rubridurum]GGM58987.1 NAD/FAD-dependent oxidoreductase [Halarchaeum rubridurum]
MTHIGVVGAGPAAAALAHVVDAGTDADVTLLEKSGGVCGRAATRRRGDVTYDYGANYLRDDDERVNDLVRDVLGTAGLADVTEPVYTFDADGTVSPGRDDDRRKWCYAEGLTQIAKRLLAGTDATVHRHTRVETLARNAEDETWTVVDTDDGRWGPFDALVCTPPAPQTAALLREADWAAETRETLHAAAAAVPFDPIYTAVLHYPFEVETPYYALVNPEKDHDVGWIAREECKPGHVPDGESVLVVQANADWSEAHFDDPPSENAAALADAAAAVLDDDRLADPDWTDTQGWRYALPRDGVADAPVAAAREHDLHVVGDWVAGAPRLHAALRCGLDAGERLVAQY